MDDFATLARDFGFRPHGKSAPMTASGAKIGVGTDDGDRVSSSAFLDKGNRDGFLFNNVIGGPTKISTANYTNSKSASTLSDLDYDSIFKNSSSTTAVGKAKNGSSSPVYDKPVYDEDIFDGLPGLKSKSTSFSVNFENVFAGFSPPKSQHRSAGFNDLHENFDRTANSDAQSQKNSTAGLDDLLPGFGGTSSASSRPLSESNGISTANSTKPIPTAAEDPFVVIGSSSKSRVSSPDMFTNPHDVVDKIGHSGKTEVKDSYNGGVFESIDFLNGFGKSVPTFASEMNTGYRMSTERNSSDSEPIRRSQFNGPETHFQKKIPYENFQDPYQTIFEVPGDSLDSHKFDAQTSSSYVYPNYDADATSTSAAHAEPSDEVWLSVSDFPIVTQVTRAPPPPRPPPPIPFRYAKEVRVKEYTKTSRTKEAVQLEKDEQTIHDDQERKYREMQERLESEQRQSEEEEKKLRRLEEEKKQRRLEEEKEQRKVEEEKEQRRLEKERERVREIAREREMGRQAVERATREARERAAIEARERAAADVRQKAERTAVQRVQAEARERATVEARERAEKAVAEARERSNAEAREKETREKAEARERATVARAEDEASERAAAEARQKAERNAVQRVQAEARERAGRAAVEARDREIAGAREKEIREKAAVARAEARQRAERAAVDRVAAEARERAAADARERATAKMGQQKNANDLDAFFSAGRASSAPRPTTNSMANSTFQSKATPEVARTSSVSASSNARKSSSTTNIIDDLSSIFGDAPTKGGLEEVEGESEERRRARLERQQRTQERAAKALAEKNQRDLQTLREQDERHRFAETLDFEIKRWAAGKEGNLRALLSSLHYVLWPECGWQPVSLTDLIIGSSVKKFYRKATLCIHPDKVQQKGATLQQKYIAEKIFDILKEAWNKFNSEELF